MATQNALPPIPRNKDWLRKKSAGSIRVSQAPSPVGRRIIAPQSASFSRKISTDTLGDETNRIFASIVLQDDEASSTGQRNQFSDTEDDVQDSGDCDDGLDDERNADLNSSTNLSNFNDSSALKADLAKLNHRYQLLQVENTRLQNLLVERLRGNSKFVGGGQFRSASQSTPPSTPKISGCSQCISGRSTLKKAKQDMKCLQTTVDELRVKLSEILVGKNQLLTTVSQKDHTIVELENDMQASRNEVKQQQITINALQVELDAALQRPASAPDDLFKKYKIQVEMGNEKESQLKLLRHEMEIVQQELLKAKNTLEDSCQENDQLKQKLDELQRVIQQFQEESETMKLSGAKQDADFYSLRAAHSLNMRELNDEIAKWKLKTSNLETQLKTLLDENEQLKQKLHAALSEQKQQEKVIQDTQKEANHLQLLRRKSCSDMMDISQKYEQLSQQYADLRGEKDRLQQDQAECEGTLARLARELDASHKQSALAERNALARACEITSLEEKITTLQSLCDTMTKKATEASSELKENGDKLTGAQNQILKQRSQVHSLQNDLKMSKVENENILNKLQEQQQTHSKSLEKAMQSLVRLCVVAPTVNVHLSGQILPCKSNLPKDAIRTIVQKDILPVFSSIFLQDSEGVGPTGSSLDTWLQSLLKEMQTSIEKHLKSVFQT